MLLGLGAVGSLGVAGRLSPRHRPPYTAYTYAQTTSETGTYRLRVAWYETYNGSFQESQAGGDGASPTSNATRVLDPETSPEYVAEAAGPVITSGSVLPGDTGTTVIGLLPESVPDSADGMDVWCRATLVANDENAVIEPERADGGDVGTLSDAMRGTVWRDTGLVDGASGCNGRFGNGDDLIQRGTLTTVLAALADGVRLEACLPVGRHRCFGVEWALPAGIGNAVQTDSLSFDLTFVGQPCGRANPFTGGSDD